MIKSIVLAGFIAFTATAATAAVKSQPQTKGRSVHAPTAPRPMGLCPIPGGC
jgi:hypothetical protein